MDSHVLGFPRVGANRELKKALEAHWAGTLSDEGLLAEASRLRRRNWDIQREAGLGMVATGDFSLYDHVLDTAVAFGATPARFGGDPAQSPRAYFALARGCPESGAAAMEMTKWFDTNYHFIVPEFEAGRPFKLSSDKLVAETLEARSLGFRPKPVLLGPVSFVALGKNKSGEPLERLVERLLPAYGELLAKLSGVCEWAQIDEPVLCADMPEELAKVFPAAMRHLKGSAASTRLLLGTYFGDLGKNLGLALASGFDALHVDLVYGHKQLNEVLRILPPSMTLSAGLVDGRNIWRLDLPATLFHLRRIEARIGAGRLMAASSCSLLHTPVDLELERSMPAAMKSRLAFATQKCAEVATLATLAEGKGGTFAGYEAPPQASPSNWEVRRRCAAVTPAMLKRKSPYATRRRKQADWLKLPLLPTTTIGSFPQTKELRAERLKFKRGEIGAEAYDSFLQAALADAISRQEELGLDVLVHGEFERNDMVEYFGERLDGFLFTENGWVQSYGSRCVKPPVIHGDVSRPKPMTVAWIKRAQALTSKPVKGMLTGPVTILNWSFVRTDLPRPEVCRQIALAIRDEVADLEAAGVGIIQIDEAALRERLPLRRDEWKTALRWMVDCFRLTASEVADTTQIHTHMCYSEFNSIVRWIAEMDADVVSVESSRSGMELLEAFRVYEYPNEIGPGVYDIHSPRVPSVEEAAGLIRDALRWVPAERLWINPDCGLKTRAWPETMASLRNMVAAAQLVRAELQRQ